MNSEAPPPESDQAAKWPPRQNSTPDGLLMGKNVGGAIPSTTLSRGILRPKGRATRLSASKICRELELYRRGPTRTLLPRLPTPWVAPAVEARDDHNPVLLNLKEYSVGEAPHSRTPAAPVGDRELHWMFRDYLKRRFDCQREPLPKLGANVVIPCPRFQQILVRLILVRFRYPDDRQRRHGFSNRPALTCSQGMTSEGFCSCRSMR